MVREIIEIDESKCNGCGACVPGCPEGALQLIDGKARLVGELLCDGLGVCVGRCPHGAISVERRESEPYDEARVMQNIVPQGVNTILAHLSHLEHNGAADYLAGAHAWIDTHEFEGKTEVVRRLQASKAQTAGEEGSQNEHDTQLPPSRHLESPGGGHHTGCPGTAGRSFKRNPVTARAEAGPSALTHWPVQLQLVNPASPHFRGSDLVLAADCTAFAMGSFHGDILAGKTLAIACPKLDGAADRYVAKLVALIDEARINTLSVVMMEVPCCGGLLQLAKTALRHASRKVPIKQIVLSVDGSMIDESWL